MSMLASMAAFALATSITPGPVNVVALGSRARHGFAASLAHVTGATAGYCLLLALSGLGLHETVARWPQVTDVVRWAGVVFLLYMAWKLAADNGDLGAGQVPPRPSLLQGAVMQWLSPKAWLAAQPGLGVLDAPIDLVFVRRDAVALREGADQLGTGQVRGIAQVLQRQWMGKMGADVVRDALHLGRAGVRSGRCRRECAVQAGDEIDGGRFPRGAWYRLVRQQGRQAHPGSDEVRCAQRRHHGPRVPG